MPRIAARNTKEEILRVSLLLFAERGYDGVSIRDIAGVIGIRESSLYKHYSGKQAIFESILSEMQRRYEVVAASLHLPQGEAVKAAEQYRERGFQSLRLTSRALLSFYLKDECAAAFRRLLTIEQYKNADAGSAFGKTLITAPLDYHKDLFAALIARGDLRGSDPEAMAMQFYAPVFLLLSEYGGHPEKEAEALAALERHLDQFEIAYATR